MFDLLLCHSRVVKYCNQHVCLSVCLFARISRRPHVQTSQNFLHMLPVIVSQSSFGDSACIIYFWFYDTMR